MQTFCLEPWCDRQGSWNHAHLQGSGQNTCQAGQVEPSTFARSRAEYLSGRAGGAMHICKVPGIIPVTSRFRAESLHGGDVSVIANTSGYVLWIYLSELSNKFNSVEYRALAWGSFTHLFLLGNFLSLWQCLFCDWTYFSKLWNKIHSVYIGT